jgi:hypothetical protein
MNASSAFAIGRAHDVCQDYAVAGLSAEIAYAILADGCSSSPDTDIGARLLVKAASRLVRKLGVPSDEACACYHGEAVGQALAHAELLGVDPRCVDATLLTLSVGGGRFFASCYGDGVIVLKRRSGEITAYSVSFTENAPHYPSYLADERRQGVLNARCTNVKELRIVRLRSNGDVIDRSTRRSGHGAEIVEGGTDDLECIAVVSDGLHSFAATIVSATSRQDERLPLEVVLPELLAFKTPIGAFVQRRMNRFHRDCSQRGWRHDDDLAIAAIHLGA